MKAENLAQRRVTQPRGNNSINGFSE